MIQLTRSPPSLGLTATRSLHAAYIVNANARVANRKNSPGKFRLAKIRQHCYVIIQNRCNTGYSIL